MKKVFKYTETRSWYFEIDVDEGTQVEKALSALQGTEGFNYYLTDRAEDEYESGWDGLSADEKRTCGGTGYRFQRAIGNGHPFSISTGILFQTISHFDLAFPTTYNYTIWHQAG